MESNTSIPICKKTCIAILTHSGDPDRPRYLLDTVKALREYTVFDKALMDVQIFCDTLDEPMTKALISANEVFEWLELNVLETIITKERFGCGKMVNLIWEHTKEYKYTLYLEGDWIIANEYKQFGKFWLLNLIKYLDENQNISTVLLRRYLSSIEMRQFNVYNTIYNNSKIIARDIRIDNNTYQLMVGQIYSNNPHLRRNSDYFDVLPLEVSDEPDTKFSDHWSEPERSAEHKLCNKYVLYPNGGIFVHAEFLERHEGPWNVATCPYHKSTGCKHQFYEIDNDLWCKSCNDLCHKNIGNIEKLFMERIRLREKEENENKHMSSIESK